MTLNELRQQYPQYASIPDGELAYRLWDKSYKDKMPMGQFADTIKMDQPAFGQMVEVAKQSGYQPTEMAFAEGVVPGGSAVRSGFQGMTFGMGDEIVGGVAAAASKVGGDQRPMGEIAQQFTNNERIRLDQYKEAKPGQALITEIAGSIASPALLLKTPAMLAKAGTAGRAAFAGGAGGTAGALYGFGTGEGDAGERIDNAIEVAIPSAIFGVGGQTLFRVVGSAGRKINRAFANSVERPTLEAMRTAKNVAYQAVDDSGLKFAPTDMTKLSLQANQFARAANYVDDVDVQTRASLKMLDRQKGKELSIGELDKLRQGLWNRYNASNGKEPAIREMIDSVDELIEGVPATNDLMQAARAANSRYKKSELLEEAFEAASRQTAATGSGGNILNKYRQSVTSILNNPKKRKWFNEQEIAQMDQFIKGSWGENVARRIGKLSPSGNGLMLALNIGAVAMDPSMMAVTALGAASKAGADASAMRGAQGILDTVANGRPKASVPYLPGAAPAEAALGNAVTERLPPPEEMLRGIPYRTQ